MHSDLIAHRPDLDRTVSPKTLSWKTHLLMMKLPQLLTALFGAQIWVGPTWYAQIYREPTAGLKSKFGHWKKHYFKLRQEAVHMKLKQLTLPHFKDNCKHYSLNALGRNIRPQRGKHLLSCLRLEQVLGHHLMSLKTLLHHTLRTSHRRHMVRGMHGSCHQYLMLQWPLGLQGDPKV